jgi:hypothetical protein
MKLYSFISERSPQSNAFTTLATLGARARPSGRPITEANALIARHKEFSKVDYLLDELP